MQQDDDMSLGLGSDPEEEPISLDSIIETKESEDRSSIYQAPSLLASTYRGSRYSKIKVPKKPECLSAKEGYLYKKS